MCIDEYRKQLEKGVIQRAYQGMRSCNLCSECNALKGGDCTYPEKVRPCESLFGIDMYKTVRKLGLPCKVLQNKTDEQNRYGFMLIE